MSIENMRSSLNSNDLKLFDDIMYNVHLSDNVHHDIIGFDDVNNFIVRSKFDTKPYTGLVFIKDGKIASSLCY